MRRYGLVWYAVIMGVAAILAEFIPALEPLEPVVIGLIAVGSPVVIYVILLRQHRLEERMQLADNLNGHLVKIVDALGAVRNIKEDRVYDSLPNRVKEELLLIEDRIGNLGVRLQGWRELNETRAAVIAEYEAENARSER